ncbi:MAG TPA: hypothetical protein DCF91_06635 [Porphyromonadaceae bacterium]|nr:hypothetical protein [Porphyromonadaceae bacterium]
MSQAVENLIVNKFHKIAEVKTVGIGSNDKPFKRYHYHNCYQIIIVKRGEAGFMINGVLKSINSQTVLMLGSDIPHGIMNFSTDIEGSVIHIPTSLLSPYKSIPELANAMQFIHDSQYGYQFNSSLLHRKVSNLCAKLVRSSGFEKMSCLFQILHLLENDPTVERLVTNPEQEQPLQKGNYHTPIERAFNYIYDHFEHDITLEQIAKYANQNPSALCRTFKKACGYTLFQYINRVRIEKACQLLHTTDLPIAEVALNVGFNSFSHFSVQFQRVTNQTPTQYREIVKR